MLGSESESEEEVSRSRFYFSNLISYSTMHSGVLVNSSNPRSNIYVCSAHMKIKYFTTNRAALTSLSVKASSARSLCAWVSIVVKIKLESLLRNVANSREREAERGDKTCLWKLKQINWLKYPRTSQNSLRSLDDFTLESHKEITSSVQLPIISRLFNFLFIPRNDVPSSLP